MIIDFVKNTLVIYSISLPNSQDEYPNRYYGKDLQSLDFFVKESGLVEFKHIQLRNTTEPTIYISKIFSSNVFTEIERYGSIPDRTVWSDGNPPFNDGIP